MKKELKVTVAGVAGSGKSRVLYLIKQALKENGFEVEFDGGNDFKNLDEFDRAMDKDFTAAINVIPLYSKVKLEEVQLKRQSI